MPRTLKDIVRPLLEKANQNQKWLAGEMEISESRLSIMLLQQPNRLRFGEIEKLASVFEISVDQFVGEFLNTEEK